MIIKQGKKMKTNFLKLLLILCITLNVKAQTNCSYTTCIPFVNTDLYQIYGALKNGGGVSSNVNSVTILNPVTTVTVSNTFNANVNNAALNFRNTNLTVSPQIVKPGPGNLYGWNILNSSSFDVYVKFCNTNAVTVGVTPIVLTLKVPAGGQVYQEPNCLQYGFNSAISVYCVNGFLDNSTATPLDNKIIIELKYK